MKQSASPPRAPWVVASVVLLTLAAASWLGGHLVVGAGIGSASPPAQCVLADPAEHAVLGFDPREHLDDPIEAWQLGDSRFLVFPTGLACTYENSNTRSSATSTYISWGPTVLTTVFAAAFCFCSASAIGPERIPRLLRRETRLKESVPPNVLLSCF